MPRAWGSNFLAISMLELILKNVQFLENRKFKNMSYGLIQGCRYTEIPGIDNFKGLSKMFNGNENSRIMSDDD